MLLIDAWLIPVDGRAQLPRRPADVLGRLGAPFQRCGGNWTNQNYEQKPGMRTWRSRLVSSARTWTLEYHYIFYIACQ